jgi:predicted DNA-binding ribbon-helix-helix protein
VKRRKSDAHKVSVSGAFYVRLKAEAERRGMPMAKLIEAAIESLPEPGGAA